MDRSGSDDGRDEDDERAGATLPVGVPLVASRRRPPPETVPDTLPLDTLPPDTLPPDTLPPDTVPPGPVLAETGASAELAGRIVVVVDALAPEGVASAEEARRRGARLVLVDPDGVGVRHAARRLDPSGSTVVLRCRPGDPDDEERVLGFLAAGGLRPDLVVVPGGSPDDDRPVGRLARRLEELPLPRR